MTKLTNEASVITSHADYLALVAWAQSDGPECGGCGYATVTASASDKSLMQSTFTLASGSSFPPVGSSNWVDASGGGNPQTGTVICSDGSGCSGAVTVQWHFSSSDAITSGQNLLNWGCVAGDLPEWEMSKLHGTEHNELTDAGVQNDIQAICDGRVSGIYVPNYWSPTFQSDWMGYLSALSNYFYNAGIYPAYVRVGMGLSDEGNPYLSGSGAATQVQTWAKASTCSAASGVDQSTFAGKWDGWQRCMLSTIYQNYFIYTPLMYAISDLSPPLILSNGKYASQDVAEWVMNQSISVGSNGLDPSWTYGPPPSGTKDEPLDPAYSTARIIVNLASEEQSEKLPSPPYFELQTENAQTMYCPNYGETCQPMSDAGYPKCAGDNIMEDVHIPQVYGNISTLEAYFDDLDNTTSTVVQAYNDWLSGTSATDTYGNQDCPS